MDLKPSQYAQQIDSKVKELGSKKEAAKALNVSLSTVKRYLKILELPKDQIDDIDAGIAPVRRAKMVATATVSKYRQYESKLLSIISHSIYITFDQIQRYSGLSTYQLRAALEYLVARKFISKNDERKTHIWSLTTRGAHYLNTTIPRHFVSSASVHQKLLRNDIELAMRQKNKTATFISHSEAQKRGLYPSLGEYGVDYWQGDKKGFALVLIDDFGMAEDRIPRALSRFHDKDKNATKGETVLRWSDLVDVYYVYTTNPSRIEVFENYFLNNQDKYVLKPIHRTIAPYWEVS